MGGGELYGVGAPVCEGIFEGAVLVGQAEGMILFVGTKVDFGSDCLIGTFVGNTVGSALGAGDFFVGSMVGAILGDLVGDIVGLVVSIAVGAVVGFLFPLLMEIALSSLSMYI